MDIPITILKFVITFVLSFIFGLNRQRAHKPVGFGTFIFVAVGSCGLAIAAMEMNPSNPLPLLGAIVTGIGFLGAGALIRTSDKIFGFTTASSVWLFAIFGLIIGVGDYINGLIIYALSWIVIFVDKHIEKKGIGSYQKRINIVASKIISDKEIKVLLGDKKYKLIHADYNRKESKTTMTYLIEGSKEEINQLAKKIFEQPWLESIHVD